MANLNVTTFDGEGLTKAWATAYPGLVGRDGALTLHLGDLRSPQRGVAGTLRQIGSTVDTGGLGHSARILFEVKAIGGEDGARKQAAHAAVALSQAIDSLDGTPVGVTHDGVTAKLAYAHSKNGPIFVGFSGQTLYRVEATFVYQAP